jgi:hypothetical protein
VCLTLTVTFAVFRPPAVAPAQGVPFVLAPGALSTQQLRPVRIPPLRFQIAIDSGIPVAPGALAPATPTPTSYPRECACSRTT